MKITILAVSLMISLIAVPAWAEQITIAGSGGMIPLMTEIAKAFMKKNPDVTVTVDSKSLGTIGGIVAVKNGAIDIGMTAKKFSKEMEKQPVTSYEIARVAVEFGVNRTVSVSNVTRQQLCDIYGGKITNWKQLGGADAPIVALSRPKSDSTYIAVRDGISCFAGFSEGQKSIVENKMKDMTESLTGKPNSIGMVDAVTIVKSGGKIKPLAIGGMNASPESVKTGQWPMIKEFTLVLGKKRTPEIKRLLQFIQSPEGQAIIRKDDALPSKFTIDF